MEEREKESQDFFKSDSDNEGEITPIPTEDNVCQPASTESTVKPACDTVNPPLEEIVSATEITNDQSDLQMVQETCFLSKNDNLIAPHLNTNFEELRTNIEEVVSQDEITGICEEYCIVK